MSFMNNETTPSGSYSNGSNNFSNTGDPSTSHNDPYYSSHKHTAYDSPTSANHSSGPHSSNIANSVDPTVDSDRSSHMNTRGGSGYNTSSSNTYGSNTHGAPTGTYGPHSSSIGNAADPRVDSDRDSYNTGSYNNSSNTTGSHGYGQHGSSGMTGASGVSSHDRSTGPASSTAGPHSSNLENKVDPSVDSDLDSSRTNPHTRSTGPASSTAGPHSSNLENKADPRIDSDLDSGRRTSGTTGTSHASTHDRTTGPASSTAGPHSSNLENKADPRVDSDLDSSKNSGPNGGHTDEELSQLGGGGDIAGVIPISGNAGPTSTKTFNPHGPATEESAHGSAVEGRTGPHHSSTANAADPRVDSDRDHRARGSNVASNSYDSRHGSTHNTAGPHESNVGNKVDPRVDSDRDGSTTTQRY